MPLHHRRPSASSSSSQRQRRRTRTRTKTDEAAAPPVDSRNPKQQEGRRRRRRPRRRKKEGQGGATVATADNPPPRAVRLLDTFVLVYLNLCFRLPLIAGFIVLATSIWPEGEIFWRDHLWVYLLPSGSWATENANVAALLFDGQARAPGSASPSSITPIGAPLEPEVVSIGSVVWRIPVGCDFSGSCRGTEFRGGFEAQPPQLPS